MANNNWIPQSYIDAQSVANQLLAQTKQEKKLPIISLDQFRSAVEEKVAMLKEDPMMMERALQYLHAISTIFLDERSKLVVLDPMDWLTNVLFLFVGESNRHVPIPNKQGVVQFSDILQHKDIINCSNEEEVAQVMKILESLEFCFPIRPQSQALVQESQQELKIQ